MIARREKRLTFRPRLLVGHPDRAYVALADRFLRLVGWEVYHARSADEVRRLAWALDPAAFVLATDLGDQTGWLTCLKLVAEKSGRKVVLVASAVRPEDRSFAEFVGATSLIAEASGPGAIIDAIHGSALSGVSG